MLLCRQHSRENQQIIVFKRTAVIRNVQKSTWSLPGHSSTALGISGYGQGVGDIVPHQLTPHSGQRSQVLVGYAHLQGYGIALHNNTLYNRVLSENFVYTFHGVADCCRTPVPKFHVLMLLVAGPQKMLTVTVKSREKKVFFLTCF